MLSLRSFAALVGVAAVVGACAARPPSGPNVWVLPSEGKDQTRFRQEDGACRQYALGQIGQGSPQQAGAASASTRTQQQRYDVAYAQCMAASGNRVPLTAGGAPFHLAAPYAYHGPPPSYYSYHGPHLGSPGGPAVPSGSSGDWRPRQHRDDD
jgi:hypothetical protein